MKKISKRIYIYIKVKFRNFSNMTVRWCPCPASIRQSPNPRRRKLHESLVSGTSRRRCPCLALIRQSPNPRRRKLHESLAPDRSDQPSSIEAMTEEYG